MSSICIKQRRSLKKYDVKDADFVFKRMIDKKICRSKLQFLDFSKMKVSEQITCINLAINLLNKIENKNYSLKELDEQILLNDIIVLANDFNNKIVDISIIKTSIYNILNNPRKIDKN